MKKTQPERENEKLLLRLQRLEQHLSTNAGKKIIRLLTEKQTAELLQVSMRTLQAHRLRGDGIPFHKVSRSIRYSLGDIEEYLNNQRRWSTSDNGCGGGV